MNSADTNELAGEAHDEQQVKCIETSDWLANTVNFLARVFLLGTDCRGICLSGHRVLAQNRSGHSGALRRLSLHDEGKR